MTYSSLPTQQGKLNTKQAWWGLIILATGLYFFANMQKVIIPGSIFSELQHDFHGTAAQISTLGSVFMYTYAGCQLIVGLLIDRYCGTRVMLIGGALFGIGSVFCAFAPNLYTLYLCRFLVGAGASSIYLCLATEASRIFTKNFTIIFSFIMLIGYSGGITGSTPFITGTKYWGWRNMLALTGLITIAFYIGIMLIKRKVTLPDINHHAKFNPRRFIDILKKWYNIRIFVLSGLAFGSYFAIQTVIGKKFLEDFLEYSPSQAGIVMTIMMIIASVNGLVTATISRWMGNKIRIFMLFMGFGGIVSMGMIFLALLINYKSSILIVGGLLIASFSANMTTIYVELIKSIFDKNHLGSALSFSNFFSYIITALFATSIGHAMEIFPPKQVDGIWIYGRNSYLFVFSLMLLAGVIRAWCSLGIKEPKNKNHGELT